MSGGEIFDPIISLGEALLKVRRLREEVERLRVTLRGLEEDAAMIVTHAEDGSECARDLAELVRVRCGRALGPAAP